jgi:LemA protein
VSAATWISLAILAVIVLWAIAVFNGLVQKRNRIANAFSQIDVQLKRRYDLVPNLVEVAKRYLAHEAATLEAVTRARGEALSAAAPRAPSPPMPPPSIPWRWRSRRWVAASVASWPWPRATPT